MVRFCAYCGKQYQWKPRTRTFFCGFSCHRRHVKEKTKLQAKQPYSLSQTRLLLRVYRVLTSVQKEETNIYV